jgi:hypothetical protein
MSFCLDEWGGVSTKPPRNPTPQMTPPAVAHPQAQNLLFTSIPWRLLPFLPSPSCPYFGILHKACAARIPKTSSQQCSALLKSTARSAASPRDRARTTEMSSAQALPKHRRRRPVDCIASLEFELETRCTIYKLIHNQMKNYKWTAGVGSDK